MTHSKGSSERNISLSPGEDFVEIPNLYSPYEIDSGKWFFHEDLIKNIKKEFESKPSKNFLLIQGYRGSGKTSTLKRIVENRIILGNEYIPIYLNAGKIRPVELGVFLLSVYKKIKSDLSISDIQIDTPEYSLRTSITIDEIKAFIEKIEEKLQDNKNIVIIFDDVGELLDAEDDTVLNSIANFFKKFIIDRKKFKLILAGRGEKLELVEKKGMYDLLNAACRLELGKFLEKPDIENLIARPVENYLQYDSAAIQEIITITGGNIYCQKLLCYHLINYLNKEQRNVCSKADVHEAVKLTLHDKREDFSYFWNHMPIDARLVAAALADKNVTKQKGQYYFLEESSLLNAIFDEEALHKILTRMAQDRYIKRIEGRRFDDYPYKIPLYGYWVQKKYSLLQTVVENWGWISEHVSLSPLGKIMSIIPIEKIPLEREIVRTTIELSQKWSAIKSSIKQRRIDRKQIEELLFYLCTILSFEIKDKPDDKRTVFTVNMNSLNLSGLEDVLFFIPEREDLTDLDIYYIQDEILRQDKPSNPSFLLCVKKSDKIQELVHKHFLGIVIIEENDLKKLALSSRPVQLFKHEILIKQVKPSLISTYKTEGPVTVTFFGRQDEIGKIVRTRNRNFAVVGARKIGKTSLLYKVREYLPSNTIPIYIDLEAPQDQNYTTFFSLLMDEMKQAYKWVIDFANDLTDMRKLIRELCQKTTKTPLFILDEIDNLLKFDKEHDYQLIKTFRALFNESLCQVILSGYKELYHETNMIESPLYNFCQPIHLDKLKKEDAFALITSPMEGIGIKYDDLEDRELILQHTSCHPNLLQFFCKHLIDKIEEHEAEEDRRTIFKKDIEDLFESIIYENYIINDFYSFFAEDNDPIEKLIILLPLCVLPTKVLFTITEIKNVLKDNNIRLSTGKLMKYLTDLTLRYIFAEERGGKYRFALPIFPEILKRRNNVADLIEEAKEDARKSL